MTSRINLIPFNPNDVSHVSQLKYQRVLCEWGLSDVDHWCELCRNNDKFIFWIVPTKAGLFTLPTTELLSLKGTAGPVNPTPDFTPLGTIAIDFIDLKLDKSLCNKDENRACVATFFILPSQQGVGLGRETMDALEKLAASPPYNVKELTLNTLSADSATSPTFWENLGVKYSPTARVNEHWYQRRGYVAYKQEPRYEEKDRNGNKVLLDAVFMKKNLTSLA